MNKTFTLLASVAAIALAAPTFAADKETVKTNTKIERDTDGNYEAKSSAEKTDVTGTKVTADDEVKVDVDSDGASKKTVEHKATKDPKGLMNKTSEKVEDTVKTDKYGNKKAHHVKKVNGDTVEDTTVEHN